MIKGDLDSLRPKVKEYYSSRVCLICPPRRADAWLTLKQRVPVVQDKDEYSTDLMKCIEEVEKQEKELSIEVSFYFRRPIQTLIPSQDAITADWRIVRPDRSDSTHHVPLAQVEDEAVS